MKDLLPLCIAIVGSGLITGLCSPLLIRLAHRQGWLDQPDLRKRHAVPTPAIGGIVLALVVQAAIVQLSMRTLGLSSDGVMANGPTITQLIAMEIAVVVILVIGLIDDYRGLPTWQKFAAQLVAGLILFVGGLRIDILAIPFLGTVDLGLWSILVTTVWVVILTNAVNLIDGLDGLACGVSLPATVALTIIGLQHSGPVSAYLSAVLGAFLLVFLFFNRHPARAFLGNSGAYLIGLLFAMISLVLPLKSYTATALFVPLIVLGVPIIETLTSVTRRAAKGQPIWQADRQHLFHLLTRAGLSTRTTVWIFWLVSALFSVFALLAYTLDRTTLIAALALFLVVIWLGFFMFTNQRLGRRRASRRSKTQAR